MGTSPEFTASAQESGLPVLPCKGEGGHVDGRLGKWFVPRGAGAAEGGPGRAAAWSRGSERSARWAPQLCICLDISLQPVSWGMTSPLCASVSSSVQWG